MSQQWHYVLCYTREPQQSQIYSPKLAYSMHLALSEDGEQFRALNHNSGVLFAKATENPNGSLNPKSLKNPYLFRMADGQFGVVAVRTEAEGAPDEQSKGSVLLFVSPDLLQYREVGLLHLKGEQHVDDVMCEYDAERNKYVLHWRDAEGNGFRNEMNDVTNLDGVSEPVSVQPFRLETASVSGIEGALPRNIIPVPRDVATRLKHKLTVPEHVDNKLPDRIVVSSEEELKAVKVTSVYSDGTTAAKPVEWHAADIDWNKPGVYHIAGTIRQDRYKFPIAINRADPCITKWNGKYYFIATNDADGNNSLYIREAASIAALVTAEEKKILDTEMYDHLKKFLWAPEFHEINGDLYIFHAGSTGEFVDIQSHVMKLKKGGDPTVASDWEMPVRVVKQDGSPLFEGGITLDMTVLAWRDRLYAIWAQRKFIPDDLGSWIYIAELNGKQPWKLKTDPVLLSKPDYGWANNHTFVDEGPYALITDKKIFVTISGALVDATYCVGLLSIDPDADLLDPGNWTKGNYPLLTSRSVPGEYGPGHNSYVTDEDGLIWNAYHARPGIDQPRSSGLRRVHFDIDGYPVLDLTEEKDLNPDLMQVFMDVVVDN